jgi:septal ring factor EnvC (AmiA/AmiB activator)
MKPAPPDPAEILLRVRQQLILAQVRIMELEDTRDATRALLGDSQQLLQSTQTLADRKLDEAAHSETVRAELLAQFEHLRHIHHLTNAALESTRTQLAAAAQALEQEKQGAAGLAASLASLSEAQVKAEAQLREVTALAVAREQRIAQLDTELRDQKASRSWRWTAWLRALERALGKKQP